MPTHYQGTVEEVLALDTYIKFTRASSTFENALFQQKMMEGLTASQFGVLEALINLGPLCQTELSAKLLKSSSNMTLVLDNLEKRGLVTRVRDIKDRRMITITLQPAGEDMIKRIFPRVLNQIVRQFSVLSKEEQKMLGSLCRRLGTREAK